MPLTSIAYPPTARTCHDEWLQTPAITNVQPRTETEMVVGPDDNATRSGKAERLRGGCQFLAQRVLHAALAWQCTGICNVRRPCVGTPAEGGNVVSTCSGNYAERASRNLGKESQSHSVRAEFFSTVRTGSVRRKGSAQRENIHNATTARNLNATRRYDRADATVRRLNDKCQEPNCEHFRISQTPKMRTILPGECRNGV
ncbi:hypothetical protein EDB87DRAFT_1825682 [Lactarius vividus]|nr:hypothetical protein EDB87DRAFT_1825682 [Lactarius vividus]